MTNTLQLDTLAFSKRLRDAGAKESLAEAIVEGLAAADTSNLATKSDLSETENVLRKEIAESKTELKAEIAEVRTELKADIAEVRTELKADIAEVRTEIAEGRTEIVGVRTELKMEIKAESAELKAQISKSINRAVFMLAALISLLIVINRHIPMLTPPVGG